MPFKSKAQRAKFYVLKSQGKMSQNTIDEWERDTPKNLPERIGPKKTTSKHSSGHWKDYTKRTGQKKPRIRRMRKTGMDRNFMLGFEKLAKKERSRKDPQWLAGTLGSVAGGLGAHELAKRFGARGAMPLIASTIAGSLVGRRRGPKFVTQNRARGISQEQK